MMQCQGRYSERGFAMLVVMVYTFLATAIVAGVTTAVLSSARVTDTFDACRKALEAAEYGESQAITEISEGGEAFPGLAEWNTLREDQGSDGAAIRRLPDFDAPGVAPVVIAAIPGAAYLAHAAPLPKNTEENLIVVYASGRYANVTRRVEAIYRATNPEEDGAATHYTRIAWRELLPSP